MEEIKIQPEVLEPRIIFTSPKQEEMIRLEKGKFFWKGQEVDDVYQIYERFNEWLKSAEIK